MLLQKTKRILEIILGALAIAVGLTGFVIPFLPGWPAFIFGVILISPHHGHKLLQYLKSLLDKLREKLKRTSK